MEQAGEGDAPHEALAPLGPEAEQEEAHALSQVPEGHEEIARLCTDLAKTARSFLFYDAHNDAIHHFLTSLRDRIEAVLTAQGTLELAIWPHEIWHEDACVYVNRDRERSLAFRLYRDGVRRLTFQPGFTDHELGKLLEAFSVRYTGVHQNEDDMVTLLWKASFDHLEIVAVEGLVLDGEGEDAAQAQPGMPGAGGGGSAGVARGGEDELSLPDDLDLPGPSLIPGEALSWVEISPEAIARLQGEGGGQALSEECVALVQTICALLRDPAEALPFQEMEKGLEEILTFLLSPRTLRAFHTALDSLEGLGEGKGPEWDRRRPIDVAGLRERLAADEAIRHLFRAASGEDQSLTPALMRTLGRLSAEPVVTTLKLLEGETSSRMRELRRHLLLCYGREDRGALRSLFQGTFGPVALDLLDAIAELGGEAEGPFLAQQLLHPDEGIRSRALELLGALPYAPSLGNPISAAFQKGEPALRRALLPRMEASGDKRFLGGLERLIQGQLGEVSLDDALACGRVMGVLGGEGKRGVWQERLTPTGFFRKHLTGTPAVQVAAAGALAACPDPDAVAMLKTAMRRGSEEAQPFIGRALLRAGGKEGAR